MFTFKRMVLAATGFAMIIGIALTSTVQAKIVAKRCVSLGGTSLASSFGPLPQQNKGITILRINSGVTGLEISILGGGMLFSGPVAVGTVIPLSGVMSLHLKATGVGSAGCAIHIGIFN